VEPTPILQTPASILARAFQRALDEQLLAYPQQNGRWACKHYTIDVTGPMPLDVICDCPDAVFRERLCKHAVTVVFCRLYGLVPLSPSAYGRDSILPNCLDDFIARIEATTAHAAA